MHDARLKTAQPEFQDIHIAACPKHRIKMARRRRRLPRISSVRPVRTPSSSLELILTETRGGFSRRRCRNDGSPRMPSIRYVVSGISQELKLFTNSNRHNQGPHAIVAKGQSAGGTESRQLITVVASRSLIIDRSNLADSLLRAPRLSNERPRWGCIKVSALCWVGSSPRWRSGSPRTSGISSS